MTFFRPSWKIKTHLGSEVKNLLTVHALDCTWFLSVMCESVLPHVPSASVPPAPESLSASLLLNEPDRRSPKLLVSVRKEEELKHRSAANLLCEPPRGSSVSPGL